MAKEKLTTVQHNSPHRDASDAYQTGAARSAPRAAKPVQLPPVRETKIAKVIALLERERGATLDEIIAVTQWQAHTARAALTGLRKKGHIIERGERGDISCYRITGRGGA